MTGFTSFLTHLPQVARAAFGALRDPAGNPKEALLAIAAVAVAALIVLVVVILVVLLVNDLRRPREAGGAVSLAPARRRRPALAATVWLVLALCAIVALTVGWRYSVRDAACSRCHLSAAAAESHAADTRHAKVACSACHVAPGLSGVLQAATRGVGSLVTQAGGKAPAGPVEATISNAACLSCHSEVAAGVVVDRGIRMRHSDVLAIGYSCTDCHSTIGHGSRVYRPTYPQMSQCLSCHDGRTAKSGCSTCHSSDVGRASRIPSDSYVKVNVQVTDCRGCHSMSTCIACHGIELPHSQQFIDGYHARQALAQPQVCLKCHKVDSFCNQCHHFEITSAGLPRAPHGQGTDFVTWHKGAGATPTGTVTPSTVPDPKRDACSCHTMYAQVTEKQFCLYCHGPQPSH